MNYSMYGCAVILQAVPGWAIVVWGFRDLDQDTSGAGQQMCLFPHGNTAGLYTLIFEDNKYLTIFVLCLRNAK